MNIDFPFHFDELGRTARAGDDDHIRDMIEQLLLTAQGERVNRPDFGSGLLHAVFEPNSPELAKAQEFAARGALQRWLGDLIEVRALEFVADGATLLVRLVYQLRASGELRTATFAPGVAR